MEKVRERGGECRRAEERAPTLNRVVTIASISCLNLYEDASDKCTERPFPPHTQEKVRRSGTT